MPIALDLVIQLMNDLLPFNRFLGIRVREISPGNAALLLPFKEELIGDPIRRVLHGGALSTLIDTCGGAAVWTLIETDDRISTVDLRVDYLRPAPASDIVCEGNVQRIGNRVGVADMKIFALDQPDKLVATGKGVYNIRRSKPEGE